MSVMRELRRRVRADQSIQFEPCLPRLAKQPPAGPRWIISIRHLALSRAFFQGKRPVLAERPPRWTWAPGYRAGRTSVRLPLSVTLGRGPGSQHKSIL